MSLDSETKNTLAAELEDVAMELANLSQSSIPTTLSKKDKKQHKPLVQAIQAEIERLADIAELYGYEALIPITTWVSENIQAVASNPQQLVEKNSAGLFYLWIELLAALLQYQEDELSAELEASLLDTSWHHSIAVQLLQQLLDSLSHSEPDETLSKENKTEEPPPIETVTVKPTEAVPEVTPTASKEVHSSYQLAPDEDVHPELLEAFYFETPDQVAEVAELIRSISLGQSDKETHQTAARIAHTIKGSSAVIGLNPVATFAHKLEDILEYSVEQPLPPEVADLLVESSDCLEAMFESLLTQSLPPQQYPQLLEQLTQWDKKFTTGFIYQPPSKKEHNSPAKESIEADNKESNPKENNDKESNNEENKIEKSSYALKWDEDVHPELLEAFFFETPDQVIEVAELIREISQGKAEKATYQTAARIAHTIKGSSAVIGLDTVASFAHKLEDILEYSVEHTLPPEVADLLIESSDCLEAIFDSLATQSLPPQQYPQLLEQLTQWDKKFATGFIYHPPAEEKPQSPAKKKETPSNKHTKKSTSSNYALAWDENIHPELLEAYLGETPEHVIDIAKLLRTITLQEKNEKNNDSISNDLSQACKTASRLAHTIKGTSAVVGINAVANFGKPLEEILDYATDHSLPSKLSKLLTESADLLESLYDSLLSEGTPPKEYPVLYKKLCQWKQYLTEAPVEKTFIADDQYHKDKTQDETPPATDEKANKEAEKKVTEKVVEKTEKKATEKAVEKTEKKDDKQETKQEEVKLNVNPEIQTVAETLTILPTENNSATGNSPAVQRTNLNETTLRVPISVIDKLLNFSSELITANTQMADQINTLLHERLSIDERHERVRTMLDELEWVINQQTAHDAQQATLQKNPIQADDKTVMDSLEMDSYNELHSITGLLSEAIEDDRKLSLSLTQQLSALKAQSQAQKQVNNSLNHTVLNMRMESVKILTPRLQRIVRETCRQTNKQAELEIIGDDLALDTDIIKGLVDPLLHLLRNAVDHGIETTKIRQQKGKTATGKIQLRFTQQGDQVVLSLKDDGAGMDANKIYQAAIKKGLIAPKTQLPDNEKLRLILQPGFSTRTKVTETSGRGVGMDVVNSAVNNLSGNIFIDSNKNQGSEIKIQVPLTLSSANILLVNVLGNTLAIPNTAIQQVHYLIPKSTEQKKGRLFIQYQQKQIPLLSLSTLLSWPSSEFIIDKSQSVLIVEHQNQRYALFVDQILKPANITIKTLKPWMNQITGINGVCLLANGIVAPVLNIVELLRSVTPNILNQSLNISDSYSININKDKILVVDDSLSNRTALRLMLEALGHQVCTAVDGADALRQIEKSLFKLVITDLEMPNMNGLEMVESLRSWLATKDIPIIMVTSRSTAKHRKLALQAGVDEYLTKPVDSSTLKSTVEACITDREY